MDDDDRLRLLFAQAFEDGQPTDDCPGPETLLDALLGVLGPEARATVIDHVAGCAMCAEAWRIGRTLTPSGDSP